MADKLGTLMQSYWDDFQVKKATTLSDFAAIFIEETPLPPDFSTDLPCLVLWGQTPFLEPMCLPSHSDSKEYEITMTVISEKYDDGELGLLGDDYTPGLYSLVETLETEYRREDFSVSQGCILLPPRYSNSPIPPLGGTCFAVLTFRHFHADRRGDNMFDYVMKPSGIISLDGTTSCPVGYKTIRVQGDGGSVTMTALPNLEQPSIDGRMCILQGMSDSYTVTFQDESNLTGSGLFLKNARDMTLGKNDTLALLYDDTQGKWIELWRTDSY